VIRRVAEKADTAVDARSRAVPAKGTCRSRLRSGVG
jgi:hypothetical protein